MNNRNKRYPSNTGKNKKQKKTKTLRQDGPGTPQYIAACQGNGVSNENRPKTGGLKALKGGLNL